MLANTKEPAGDARVRRHRPGSFIEDATQAGAPLTPATRRRDAPAPALPAVRGIGDVLPWLALDGFSCGAMYCPLAKGLPVQDSTSFLSLAGVFEYWRLA